MKMTFIAIAAGLAMLFGFAPTSQADEVVVVHEHERGERVRVEPVHHRYYHHHRRRHIVREERRDHAEIRAEIR